MIVLRSPQALLLLPMALLFVLLAASLMSRWARALRFLLLATLAVALAEPVRPGTPPPAPLLVLVDQSLSLPPAERTVAWQSAQALAAAHGDAQTAVGAIGATTRLVPSGESPTVDPNGTDLGAALRLAGGRGGHAVMISDGGATNTDTDAVAGQLRQAGVVVDVVPITPTLPLDARVAAINVPSGLREGQRFAADIVVSANQPVSATLHLLVDGSERSVQPVALAGGQVVVPFNGTLDRAGLHTLRAVLDLPDAHPENNSLDQTALVGPAPKVLVIEQTPDAAATLRNTLEHAGIQSEARRPPDLPARVDDLARFDAVVLNDIPASALRATQQVALRDYVRTLGHGLVVLGGQASFGLGGYRDTTLETILPVNMQPPPRRERQQVAVLLMIDRSASMYGYDPRTSKMELAKSAAIGATNSLVADDQVGVLTFDTDPIWPVPFTAVGEGTALQSIQQKIASIDIGGGTDIYAALAAGLPELARQSATVKHAVLLTDGRSYTRESYDNLIATARGAGITLSTIAIGNDADTTLLQHLADVGGGRYHFAANPQELPRLTLEETEIARSDPRVVGTFQPQADAPHAAVRGLVPSQFPTVGGFVATTPKQGADTILHTPSGDVLLAGWQFGLGRVMAWTSDSGAQWAPNWQSWPDAGLFWSQLLGYTFPDPATGPLTVKVDTNNGTTIEADAIDSAGASIDLADVVARVTGPDGHEQILRLKETAPGRYGVALNPSQAGAYTIAVGLHKGATELNATTGYVKSYAAEFARAADPALLARVASATGGTVWPSLDSALAGVRSQPQRPERPYWPWLVALAIGLWLLEIAVRRDLFGRRSRAP